MKDSRHMGLTIGLSLTAVAAGIALFASGCAEQTGKARDSRSATHPVDVPATPASDLR